MSYLHAAQCVKVLFLEPCKGLRMDGLHWLVFCSACCTWGLLAARTCLGSAAAGCQIITVLPSSAHINKLEDLFDGIYKSPIHWSPQGPLMIHLKHLAPTKNGKEMLSLFLFITFEINFLSLLSGMTWEQCIERCPQGVVPACHNAEDTVTISGPQVRYSLCVFTWWTCICRISRLYVCVMVYFSSVFWPKLLLIYLKTNFLSFWDMSWPVCVCVCVWTGSSQ